MAEVTQVAVPDIGDFSDVPVIEVLVNEGDAVEVDAPLVTLESDKATMEIPAPVAGVVDKLLVKLGDKVSEGTPIATIAAGNGAAADAPAVAADAPAPAADAPAVTADAPAVAVAADASVPADPIVAGPPAPTLADPDAPPPYASPLARRIAREMGVDLASVH